MGTVSDGVDYLKAHAVTTSSSLEDMKKSLDETSSGVDAIVLVNNGNGRFYYLTVSSHDVKQSRDGKALYHQSRTFSRRGASMITHFI